ncbi:signal transduction histidine kinase [Candidatus Magnetobacterium bavaricum]|uniref:Signal transduction histidine kinase n=1 Tax=Candidatus Magnetobacterium bavaricum TaxID=29290 RepID=A0A0F3GPS9_9BACT|nr:signal transduction histidine kinase [Candidatus Magnetobacterium bavaricum]
MLISINYGVVVVQENMKAADLLSALRELPPDAEVKVITYGPDGEVSGHKTIGLTTVNIFDQLTLNIIIDCPKINAVSTAKDLCAVPSEAIEDLAAFDFRLMALLNSTSDIIFFKDTDRRFILFNDAFKAFVGLDDEDIKGHTTDHFFPPTIADAIRENEEEVLRTGKIIHAEQMFTEKTGTTWHDTVNTPVFDVGGTIKGLLGISRDITTMKVCEIATSNSEKKHRTLVENTQDIIISYDGNYVCQYVNPSFRRHFHLVVDEFVGKSIDGMHVLMGVAAEDTSLWKEALQKVSDTGCPQEISTELKTQLGTFYFDNRLFPEKDQDARVHSIVVVARDITRQHAMEKEMLAALKDKTLLLKELHDRVKNNLQIISSLMSLSSERISDTTVLNIFNDIYLRIRAMTIIHEKLYESTDMSKLNFAEFVEDIVAEIIRSYEVHYSVSEVKIDVKSEFLDINMAVPCGLVICELVSNAVKYAFPGNIEGTISIYLEEVDNTYLLIVGDNGAGMPAGIDNVLSKSFGLTLVHDLVTRKLRGKINVDRTVGTVYRITWVKR